MGCGTKEASLEIFESQLKKLLHIIDKLPKLERERAVDILKISANRYSSLTVTQSLEDTDVPCTLTPTSYCAPLQADHYYSSTTPSFTYPAPTTTTTAPPTRLESESILAELGGLGEDRGGGVGGLEDDWDQHVIGTDLYCSPASPTCALCLKTFSLDEFIRHYQPVSCRGCRQEVCNTHIFRVHAQTCPHTCHPLPKRQEIEVNNEITTSPAIASAETTNKPTENPKTKKQQNHECEECGNTFLTAFQLNKHRLGHTNNNCDKCDAKFAKKRLLVHHLKTVHYIATAEKYYSCNICSRKFVKKPSLWSHLTEHTVGDQVVCLKCGDILDDDAAFEQHTDKHRKNAQYTCNRCGEFFLRNQQYLAHLQGHDKYRCKLCKKDFSSKKKFKIHKNTEHDTTTSAKASKSATKTSTSTTVKHENFTCVVCLQSYKNEALFKAHDCSKESKAKEKKASAKDVTIKLAPGRFKCKFCDFEHRKCSAVVRHARMHRNKKRFVCELCGSAFNAHYTLKEHRNYVHSEIRRHSCPKCGKTFKAKNALIRHEQVHSENRPFVCHCGQQYKRSSHLRRHLSTSHQGATAASAKPDADRYRTSDWGETREGGRIASLSASAALDVVTSLDLNMKGDSKSDSECKQEKSNRSTGVVSYQDREDQHGEMDYQSVDNRGDSAYQNVKGETSAYPVTESRGAPTEYVTSEADKAYYRTSSYPQSKQFTSDRFSERVYSGVITTSSDRYYPPPLQTERPVYHRQEKAGLAYTSLDRGYSSDPRYSLARDQTYIDSVPADLTMASSSSSRDEGGRQLGYPRVSEVGPRQRYNNYLYQQRHAGPPYPQATRIGYYGDPRGSLTDQGGHRDAGSRAPPLSTGGLEQLEDPAYLGYPTSRQPPGHYFEQLDTYLHSGREDLELGQLDKKHKGRRDEGGLLPPLLALAPHDRPGSPPHPLKMDYLCPTQDQLSSQYLQDSTIDYNTMDY